MSGGFARSAAPARWTLTPAACAASWTPGRGRYVVNCWGVGYRLIDAPEAEDAGLRSLTGWCWRARWWSAARPRSWSTGDVSAAAANCSTVACTSCAARFRRYCSWPVASPTGSGAAATSSSRRSRRSRGSSATSTASRAGGGPRWSTAGPWPRMRSGGGAGRRRSRAAGSSSRGALTDRRLECDEAAIAGALDNLIANALEHGAGPIRIDGAERAGRLRLTVADGVDAGGRAAPPAERRRSPRIGERRRAGGRRGHGLRIVAEVAADHGGRFAACAHELGASAVLELPLARAPAPTSGR